MACCQARQHARNPDHTRTSMPQAPHPAYSIFVLTVPGSCRGNRPTSARLHHLCCDKSAVQAAEQLNLSELWISRQLGSETCQLPRSLARQLVDTGEGTKAAC